MLARNVSGSEQKCQGVSYWRVGWWSSEFAQQLCVGLAKYGWLGRCNLFGDGTWNRMLLVEMHRVAVVDWFFLCMGKRPLLKRVEQKAFE